MIIAGPNNNYQQQVNPSNYEMFNNYSGNNDNTN